MRRAVLAAAVALIASLPSGSPAQAAADYSSFFWQRELEGAGWAACEEPVTWSIDVRGFTSRQAKREINRLEQAWAEWSQASGVFVRFSGKQSLAFDPATNGLRATDGSAQPYRHVYLAFKTRSQVPIMTQAVIGLAMPSSVQLPEREIVAGMAIFRKGYILEHRKTDSERVMHIYLHELGHVIGLGHSGLRENVMYPTLDHETTLSSGDIAGAKAMTQPCTHEPASATGSITDWRE